MINWRVKSSIENCIKKFIDVVQKFRKCGTAVVASVRDNQRPARLDSTMSLKSIHKALRESDTGETQVCAPFRLHANCLAPPCLARRIRSPSTSGT